MTNAVYIFPTARPIFDALEAVFPSQQNAHVARRNSWIAAYGDQEGYERRQREKAASHARLVSLARTDKATADFLKRVANSHAEWQRNR